MNVRIREVEKDDLKSVSDIIVRGWQTAYMGIVDDTFLDDLCLEKTYQRLLTNYKENGFIVAECENNQELFMRVWVVFIVEKKLL